MVVEKTPKSLTVGTEKHECQGTEMRKDGWDGFEGHNAPCQLKKIEGRWNLVCPDWYSVDISHCPWCGERLVSDKFMLAPTTEKAESAQQSDQDVDKALADLEALFPAVAVSEAN